MSGTHIDLSLQQLKDKEPVLVLDKERVQWVCLDKEPRDMVLQFGGKYNRPEADQAAHILES